MAFGPVPTDHEILEHNSATSSTNIGNLGNLGTVSIYKRLNKHLFYLFSRQYGLIGLGQE